MVVSKETAGLWKMGRQGLEEGIARCDAALAALPSGRFPKRRRALVRFRKRLVRELSWR